jgi:hypothetical protein
MKNLRILTLIGALFLTITGSSCGTAPSQPTEISVSVQPTQTAEIEPTSIPATQVPEPTVEPMKGSAGQEPAFKDFDPNNFENSTNIDNRWSPMKPGMFWAYDGTIVDEGEIIPHRIEFTISDLTKEIQGVQTVVIWSEDYTRDKLVEKEIAFYAQDKDGRIWYFGEYPEEYENDQFVKAPAWIAGIQGARAGVKMEAGPQLGMPDLFQGWGPAVEWSDYGHVDQTGLKVCVPVNCYEDVLVIAESSLDEKGAFQLKYFAPDLGEIQVGWKGTDVNQEELVLTEYKLLSSEELAKIHAMVLSLEKHAYEVSKDVYGQTSPIQ